jgi:hypothetical protein
MILLIADKTISRKIYSKLSYLQKIQDDQRQIFRFVEFFTHIESIMNEHNHEFRDRIIR